MQNGEALSVRPVFWKRAPTFGKYVAVELNEENHLQFFIPRGFAHGFAVLSDTAIFQYKCDNYYAPQSEGGILLQDKSLGIDWRIPQEKAILSDKDITNPLLADLDNTFDINVNLYSE